MAGRRRYDRTVIRIDSGRGQLGEALPDLTLPTLDGTPFALNSLRGRRFLLFFWGSW
jgi:hypothetical protein